MCHRKSYFVNVPKNLIDLLGIKKGDMLLVSLSRENRIVLEPVTRERFPSLFISEIREEQIDYEK